MLQQLKTTDIIDINTTAEIHYKLGGVAGNFISAQVVNRNWEIVVCVCHLSQFKEKKAELEQKLEWCQNGRNVFFII